MSLEEIFLHLTTDETPTAATPATVEQRSGEVTLD
jgi:hypothetical protein